VITFGEAKILIAPLFFFLGVENYLLLDNV